MDLVSARTWINFYYGIGMKIIWSLMAAAATLYGADTRPVIVCFGDSLTAGFGLDSGQSYPSLLQRELDRRGFKYRVENLGVSGYTTQDGLASVSMALALKPVIAVIELGANDGLRGQPVSGIERNLAQIIEAFQRGAAFQKAKIRVLLAGITLPPDYGPDYVHRFAAIYPGLAAKYKVRLLDFLLAGVAGNPRLMQQDGLHPNAEGTRIVAATVFKSLLPML
jgi:acyl-CoA thioesterase-1